VSRDTPSTGHQTVAERAAGALDASNDSAPIKSARNAEVDNVAKMYEKQFLREMVKAMRQTVSPAAEPSMATQIYQGQMDEQYVESWGDTGGIGLSNIIYDQIMQRYFPNQAEQTQQPARGPIALSDRDVSRVVKLPSQTEVTGQVPLRVEIKPSATGAPASLKLPWDGEIKSQVRMGSKTAVTLDHGRGLASSFVFEGVAGAEVEPGRQMQKGQTFGILSPEANSFFWNLRKSSAL
jgi:flagellar protein FlgJ